MARAKSLEDMTPQELIDYTKSIESKSDLFQTLLDDPKYRKDALRMVKAKNPTMAIPEIDSASDIETRLAAEAEERKKLEAQMRDRDIRDRVDRERARVMKTHDLTEADMVEVEKIMTDKEAPIPHYDAAAKVFKAQRIQATPTPAAINADRQFTMPNKDEWGKGVGNKAALDKTALDMAYKAASEIGMGKSRAA